MLKWKNFIVRCVLLLIVMCCLQSVILCIKTSALFYKNVARTKKMSYFCKSIRKSLTFELCAFVVGRCRECGCAVLKTTGE